MRSILLLILGMAWSAVAVRAGGSGTVTARGQAFRAEVASTEPERARGLMGRAQLATDACMIFLYDQEGTYRIWMKNCLIALDVAWVDAEGRVVELVAGVPPPSPLRVYRSDADYPNYGGSVPSRSFVEFPAGTIKRLGLKKGDRLEWDLKLGDGSLVRVGPKGKARK